MKEKVTTPNDLAARIADFFSIGNAEDFTDQLDEFYIEALTHLDLIIETKGTSEASLWIDKKGFTDRYYMLFEIKKFIRDLEKIAQQLNQTQTNKKPAPGFGA